MGVLEALVEVIGKHADATFELADAIDRYADRAFPDEPPAPSPPAQILPLNERHLIFGETRMDIEQFALTYPEHPTADVVDRVVTLTIAPGATLPAGLPDVQVRHIGRAAGNTDSDLTEGRDYAVAGAFEVPQGVAFSVSTVSVDDAGNQSAAVVQEFTAEDRTSPEAVGGASVAPLGERTVADPV